jgi:ribosomal protein S26
MIRKITGVELEKPNCESILIFHCSSCQKEFPFEEAHFVTGHGKIVRNRLIEDLFVYQVAHSFSLTGRNLSLYCKECAQKI